MKTEKRIFFLSKEGTGSILNIKIIVTNLQRTCRKMEIVFINNVSLENLVLFKNLVIDMSVNESNCKVARNSFILRVSI